VTKNSYELFDLKESVRQFLEMVKKSIADPTAIVGAFKMTKKP